MNRLDPDTANNSVDNSITSYNNDDDLNRKIIGAFEEVDNFIRENRQLFECQPKEIKNILEKLSTNLDIIQQLAISYEEMRQNNMNIHQYNTKVGEINQEEIKRLQVIYDEKKIKSLQSLEATQLQQQIDQLQVSYQDKVKENIDLTQIIKRINDMMVQNLCELNLKQTINEFKIEIYQEKTQEEQINYFKEIFLSLIEKQNSPLLNQYTNQPDLTIQNSIDLQNERNIKIMNQLNSEIRNTLIMEKEEIQKLINKNSKMQQTQCSDEDFQSGMEQQQLQIAHNSSSFKESMDTIQQKSDEQEILSSVFEQIQIILRDVKQSTQTGYNILQTNENADVNIQQAKQHIVMEQKTFSQQCVNIKDQLTQLDNLMKILISSKENSSKQLQKAIDEMNKFQFEIYQKIKHNCLNQEINQNLNSNEILDELDKLIKYPAQQIIKQNEKKFNELAISIEHYKRFINDQQSEINLLNIQKLGDDSEIIRLIEKLEQLDLEKALIIDDLGEIKKQFEEFKEDSNLKQQILKEENENLILLNEKINDSNQIEFNKQQDKIKSQPDQTESQQYYLDQDQIAMNDNQNISLIQQTSQKFLINDKSSILDKDKRLISLSNHNQNDSQLSVDEQQINQPQQDQVQQKLTIMSSYIQNEDQKKMVWISDIDSLFENEHFKSKFMRLFESIKDFSQTLVDQWIDFLRIPLFSKSMVSMANDDKDFLNNKFKLGIIEASNPKTLQELIQEVISIHIKLQDFNKKLLDQLSIHFQRKEISSQNLIKKFAMCKTELKIIKK